MSLRERRVQNANAIARLCYAVVRAEIGLYHADDSNRAERAAKLDALVKRLWDEHGIDIDADVCRECGS